MLALSTQHHNTTTHIHTFYTIISKVELLMFPPEIQLQILRSSVAGRQYDAEEGGDDENDDDNDDDYNSNSNEPRRERQDPSYHDRSDSCSTKACPRRINFTYREVKTKIKCFKLSFENLFKARVFPV